LRPRSICIGFGARTSEGASGDHPIVRTRRLVDAEFPCRKWA
jgi:hypothetical protein